MSPAAIRAWSWVHRWTSLVCTAFLLLLCLTGLPLIFHEEIEAAFSPPLPTAQGAQTLDQLVAAGQRVHPGAPLFLSFDDRKPLAYVTTGPAPDAKPEQMETATIDRRSGEPARAAASEDVMEVIFRLHVDLFAGLPGMLFLGLMGLLFAAAIVSGVVLYAPFMRKLPFGALRTDRSPRIRWLDWHNLLGVVTVAWAMTVGLTGVVNTLATPIIAVWQAQEVKAMSAGHKDDPPPARLASVDKAVASALTAAPGMQVSFVAFPGGAYATPRHYAVFLHGATPLTKTLIRPALVDAETGELTALRDLPWYAKTLLLSQPLHFGDYGGLPLKILWALLDLAAIVVLGSGLYLWLAKRSREARAEAPAEVAA
jgi:uncharacterized iron-regulated membrane protein